MSDLDLYRETILEEAAHPQGRKVLGDADHSARYGNASCGDMFTVQVKLSVDKQQIQEIAWQGEGCAISTAAMSQVVQQLPGKTPQEIAEMTFKTVSRWLGLEQVSPGRISCVGAGLKAVQKALQVHFR